MSNTCDTCKWWHPVATETAWAKEGFEKGEITNLYRDCNNPKLEMKGNYRFVSKAYEGPFGPVAEEKPPDIPLDGMAAQCSNYLAMISTGPKFGCIHHEPK